MSYEPGMSISLQNKKCIVFFRGKKYELHGEFENYSDALRAGEDHCQTLGWVGSGKADRRSGGNPPR